VKRGGAAVEEVDVNEDDDRGCRSGLLASSARGKSVFADLAHRIWLPPHLKQRSSRAIPLDRVTPGDLYREGEILPGPEQIDSIVSFMNAGYTQVLWIWCPVGDLKYYSAALYEGSRQLTEDMPISIRTLRALPGLKQLQFIAERDTPVQLCKDIVLFYVLWLYGGIYSDLKVEARPNARCRFPGNVEVLVATEPVKEPGLTNRRFYKDPLAKDGAVILDAAIKNSAASESLADPSAAAKSSECPEGKKATTVTPPPLPPPSESIADHSAAASSAPESLAHHSSAAAKTPSASESLADPSAAASSASESLTHTSGAAAEANSSAPDSVADHMAEIARCTLVQVWLGFLCALPRARFLKRCFDVLLNHWLVRAKRHSGRERLCWDVYQPLWMSNVTLVTRVLREEAMLSEAVLVLPPAAAVPLPAWLRPESWRDRLGTRVGHYGYYTPSPFELATSYACLAVTLWTERQGWTTEMRRDVRAVYAGPTSPWADSLYCIIGERRVAVKSLVVAWRAELETVYPSWAVFRVLASAVSILEADWADHVLHDFNPPAGLLAFVIILLAWQWELFEFISWRPELLEFARHAALRPEHRRPAKMIFQRLVSRFAAMAPQVRNG